MRYHRGMSQQRRDDPESYFWANVEKRGPDECWPWKRAATPNGYGQMWDGDRRVGSHVFAYRQFVGPIPKDENGTTYQVDHLCHTPECTLRTRCPHRLCANPAHLDAKPGADNRARGITARPGNGADLAARTHCPRGHAYDEANTFAYNGSRRCRACYREKAREKADLLNPNRQAPARERTHCPQGHPYDDENTYIGPEGDRLCRTCRRDRERERYRATHEMLGHGNARKTHCPQGHEYTPENTKVSKTGGRSCRECIRVANREYMRAKRAAKRAAAG